MSRRMLTNRVVVFLGIGLWLAGVAGAWAQVTVSNSPVADAFVRSADPTHNYGAAGALSVSGSIATNAAGVQQGQFDSFLRFDISGMVAQFNASFGAGNWAISGANLKLTEVGAPSNAIFNRGIGQFEVRWITNDLWSEGSGTPTTPTTDDIVWNDEASVLNPGQDTSLGTFSNAGADGLRTLSLATPSALLNDITAGGLISFYLTATPNSTVGFTFDSRNFGTVSARPFLELTAVAVPEPTTLALVGLSVFLLFGLGRAHGKNGHVEADRT